MAENIAIPEIWVERGAATEQQVIDAMNEAFESRERLGSNIYVGDSGLGSICLILDHESGELADAYPAKIDKSTFDQIMRDVDESGLGEPDEMHLQIISLALAIDLLNYYDDFLNKDEVGGRYALFESSVHTTDAGEILIISVEGLGRFAVGYETVKSILAKYA